MKRFCIALACLLVTTSACADAPLLPPRVAQAVQQRIDTATYPVVVIGVVDGDRSAVYAYGKLDGGRAPDGDTVFEIGSITKTFTATLLAQQVVAGKLQLDQPVATLLPGFTIPSRDGKKVTLGNLATQNSGLPRLPTNFAPANPNDPYADYDAAKLKTFLASYTLPRDPGATFEYSNLGVGLLGYALAVHAGTSYGQLLQQQIFQPLGMQHSSSVQSPALTVRLVPGHGSTGEHVANWHFDALAGAGAIVSTADDMLRYLKANMGRQPSPLYPAMQLAQTPRAEGPRPSDRLGLVWMVHHDAGGDLIEHNGMTAGYASYIGFTADRQHGVVVLTNTNVAVDDLGQATLLSDIALAPAHKRIAVTAQELEAYDGAYQLRPGFEITVFHKGDQMLAQGTGQPPFPLYASGKDEFFANVSDIRLSFQRDGHGKVDKLVLHQHGDRVAPRVGTQASEATVPHAVALDATTLATYVGQYQLAPGAVMAVTVKDGQPFVQLTGQPAFPLFASAKDKFFLRVVDAQIDFERDAGGKVVALTLHQNGADQRAPRIGQ